MFIAYGRLCAEDGLPYVDGKCAKGHSCPDRLELRYCVDEERSYEIVSLEDVSHGMAKRLSAIVLVDRHYSCDAIREVVREAVKKVRHDVFARSSVVEARFGDRPAHVVWVYVAADRADVTNCNWICRARWIDPELAAEYRPSWDSTEDVVDGAAIVWNAEYHPMKAILSEATGTKAEVVKHVENHLARIEGLVVQAASRYEDYCLGNAFRVSLRFPIISGCSTPTRSSCGAIPTIANGYSETRMAVLLRNSKSWIMRGRS